MYWRPAPNARLAQVPAGEISGEFNVAITHEPRLDYLFPFFRSAAGGMRDFTDTVRDSADIERVISEYVSLRGVGNALKGLCPFHTEKTPSFTVNRDKQLFH